jgi:hypothetical protein
MNIYTRYPAKRAPPFHELKENTGRRAIRIKMDKVIAIM